MFPEERLYGTGKININIKGEGNLKSYNKHVFECKEINPNAFKYKNKLARKVARYGKEVGLVDLPNKHI